MKTWIFCSQNCPQNCIQNCNAFWRFQAGRDGSRLPHQAGFLEEEGMPKGGLEPPLPQRELTPQASVSANSTTSAQKQLYFFGAGAGTGGFRVSVFCSGWAAGVAALSAGLVWGIVAACLAGVFSPPTTDVV
jgi:hypothetical protein